MNKQVAGITVGTIVLFGTMTAEIFVPKIFAPELIVRAQAHNAQTQRVSGSQSNPKNQQIVVHLKRGTDDLHSVLMALHLASDLQKRGAKVTLLLTLEAVRLADTTQPLDLQWGKNSTTVANLYQDFLKTGGTVLVCPACAEAVGMNTSSLRSGAQMAVGDRDISSLMLAADVVLDF